MEGKVTKKRFSVALDLNLFEDFRYIARENGLSVDKAASMVLADYINKKMERA